MSTIDWNAVAAWIALDRQIEELFLEVTKILASLLQEQQKRIPV